jgi:hypothetical protein
VVGRAANQDNNIPRVDKRAYEKMASPLSSTADLNADGFCF